MDGLVLLDNFISKEEEEELIEFLTKQKWEGDSNKHRRVQHYGTLYDYEHHKILSSEGMQIPPLLQKICNRLVAENILKQPPENVIVNEYVHHQGIGPHIDSLDFGDTIVSLSLGSSVPIVFRKSTSKQPHVVVLEPCSLLVMSGAARFDCTHEIPYSKLFHWEENGTNKKHKRGKGFRRIAITFRNVKACQ